jgi:sugar/nucleoside kinase (ribokinase family)
MIYLIGNPTHDRIRIGAHRIKTLGGTVVYAAILLAKLGYRVAVVGKGDRLMRKFLSVRGIDVRYFRSADRVVEFDNDYRGGRRVQKAKAGDAITLEDIPGAAFTARALLVGAVLQEVTADVAAAPRRGLLMIDAQGILRRLGPDGTVSLGFDADAERMIGQCDILKADEPEARVISETENIQLSLRRMHGMGPTVVILTLGRRGAWIYDGHRPVFVDVPGVVSVDPTGAGDVFEAAFLVQYLAGAGLGKAGRFAAAAAALSTRSFGPSAIPSPAEINACMRTVGGRAAATGKGSRD